VPGGSATTGPTSAGFTAIGHSSVGATVALIPPPSCPRPRAARPKRHRRHPAARPPCRRAGETPGPPGPPPHHRSQHGPEDPGQAGHPVRLRRIPSAHPAGQAKPRASSHRLVPRSRHPGARHVRMGEFRVCSADPPPPLWPSRPARPLPSRPAVRPFPSWRARGQARPGEPQGHAPEPPPPGPRFHGA
jgi:hypothetical protein